MTDRIRIAFETFARKHGFDCSGSGDRYNRPVVRWMWEAWKQQAEHINGLTAALARNAELVRQCRDHDTRRAAAVAQAAGLAEEVERLTAENARLAAVIEEAREQEPVAHVTHSHEFGGNHFNVQWLNPAAMVTGTLLYAAPKPATHDDKTVMGVIAEDCGWKKPAAPAVPDDWLNCWLIEHPASSEWPAIWLTITTDGRRWVSDGGTMYASGGDWYFTTAAVEALKFADKESAEEYIRHNRIKDVLVTEHIFYGDAAPIPTEPKP